MPRRFSRAFASLLTALLLAAALSALSAAPAAAAPAPSASNLAGVWKDSIDITFRIEQDPGGSSLTSTVLNDTCTSGPRSFVIQADIDGVSLNGTMQRCDDKDHPLVVNCGTPAIWETPFTANVTDGRIVGERRGEWWVWDTDENGSWVNCTLDYYFQVPFELERVDCGVKTFAELAEHHIADPAERPAAIALAQAFEDGQKLDWTEGQLAPGGLKEKADILKAGLERWDYSVTYNSAYRPVLYQGHFADLRICGLQLRDTLLGQPYLAEYLADSVDAVNAEVAEHGIKAKAHTAAGLTINVPFVCWREPLTNCPHTDERAVDMTVVPDDARADWIGSMFGMCRPYLFAKTPDRPHWEYLGPDPFSTPKCSAVGRTGLIDLSISGNSPINILLEDSTGRRLGYDPALDADVNDFGYEAYYSGKGTQPQVIEVAGYDVSPGAFSVTGVGTGDGEYTINYSVVNDGGYVLDDGGVAGHAALNASTARLDFTVRDDYSPPDLWSKATVLTLTGAATDFAVGEVSGSPTVKTSGGYFSDLMFSADGKVLAVRDDGAGGAASITVPPGLLGGDFTVRVDGAVVPFTRTDGAAGATLAFDRPAGGEFITVEATAIGGGAAAPPPAGGSALLIAVLVAVAAASVVAFLLFRRRGKPTGASQAPPKNP